MLRPFLKLVVTLGCICKVCPAYAAPITPPTKFKILSGAWAIDAGPLAGTTLVIGPYPGVPNNEADLIEGDINAKPNLLVLDTTIYKPKRDSFNSSYSMYHGPNYDKFFGVLGEAGTMDVFVDDHSPYIMEGSFKSRDATIPELAFQARAVGLQYPTARIVLEIEPAVRRPYKVGEWITYQIKLTTRGLAVVPPSNAALHFAVDSAVTEFSVSKEKNLACTVNSASDAAQVICPIGFLGPKHLNARAAIRVKAPEALSGKRLVAAVAVLKEDAFESTLLKISSASRRATLKIKKSKTTECKSSFVGTWHTNYGSTMVINADGTITDHYNGNDTYISWSCEVKSGKTVLLFGKPPDDRIEHYYLTKSGHWEGNNSLGWFISADKV